MMLGRAAVAVEHGQERRRIEKGGGMIRSEGLQTIAAKRNAEHRRRTEWHSKMIRALRGFVHTLDPMEDFGRQVEALDLFVRGIKQVYQRGPL